MPFWAKNAKITENMLHVKWHNSERCGAYVFRTITLNFGYVRIYV